VPVIGLVAAVWVVRFVIRSVGIGLFSLASGHGFLPHAQLALVARGPRRRAADSAARSSNTSTADMRRYTFVGLDARGLNGGVGRAVAKPLALKRLELPLSEKQIPQVVENLESGGKTREALETA
jgi:hypothetical protein